MYRICIYVLQVGFDALAACLDYPHHDYSVDLYECFACPIANAFVNNLSFFSLKISMIPMKSVILTTSVHFLTWLILMTSLMYVVHIYYNTLS